MLLAFILSVYFGIIIEILQGFYTNTRAQDVMDILANTFGGTTAMIVILLYYKMILKK